ncbi:MAG: HIT domain-containing protein [Candidatus Yonathbacteria bacterium]|nr:HIT domain-containing protein [Candidatus Yonathbacteria bacterium]
MDYFDVQDPILQNRLVAENATAFAFLGYQPIVSGHTLICPKRPVATWDELTTDEIADMFALRKKLKTVMEHVFGAQGFNYAWNEQEIAGQSVPHVHLHMLPRKEGDTGIVEYEPRVFLYRPGSRAVSQEEELANIAATMRATIS